MDTVEIPKALARMLFASLKEALESDGEEAPPTIPFKPKPFPGREPRKPQIGMPNPWEKKKLTGGQWSDAPFPDRHGWTVTC